MPADRTIGYAVVGLGWISQAAMLPGFANAENSRLAALVSGSEDKRRGLARRYGLPDSATYHYDDYDACLDRPDVQAVYIALPNHLHREYAVRAAEKGVHVLCEKPMAPTEEDCRAMIEAADRNEVKLMIAYRLHLEPAHLRAIELVRTGAIGDPRLFDSVFSQQIDPEDVRVTPAGKGGGAVYDIGVYCINAARYLFGAEPLRVRATAVSRPEPRFSEIEEAVGCTLTFPDDRLASFTCSFGAAAASGFRVVGTAGDIAMHHTAFEFQGDRELVVRDEGGERREPFPETDQFGAQLVYFSDCILEGRDPEPDGEEGLIDVMIIRAIYRALESDGPVDVRSARARRPDPDAAIRLPRVKSPELIGAEAPGD